MPFFRAFSRTPLAFVCHTSPDKPFARRLARRLHAYGIDIWLDEQKLQDGATLTPSLQKAIRRSSHFLVVASDASTTAPWVGTELDFVNGIAPSRRPKIIPVFVADVMKHPRFADHLGRSFQTLHLVDQQIEKLAAVIMGGPVSINPTIARQGLEELRRETPALSTVIDACLGKGELPQAQLAVLSDRLTAFDDIECALTSGYDAAPNDQPAKARTAYVAARAFGQRGAGWHVLRLDSAAQASGRPSSEGVALVDATGQPLDKKYLESAIALLRSVVPPNDHALMRFVERNFEACDEPQRRALVGLVTMPERKPRNFAADAAFALYTRMPKDESLYTLWHYWIHDGDFEADAGNDSTVGSLFSLLNEGLSRSPADWDRLVGSMLSRVKILARSRNKNRVDAALDYMRRAADARFARLDEICSTLERACRATEWDGWEHRSEMTERIVAYVEAARSDKDWMRAWNNYQAKWQVVQRYEATVKNPPDSR